MAKKKAGKSQSARFIEAAKEVGADSKQAFERAFKKVIRRAAQTKKPK